MSVTLRRKARWVGLAVLMMAALAGCWNEEPSPERWAEVELGMTTTEVREIMGPPDARLTMPSPTAVAWVYRTEDGTTYIEFDDEIVRDIREGEDDDR